MSDFSALGSSLRSVRSARSNRDIIGTAPTLLYDRMRSIDATAKSHDLQVDKYVATTSPYVPGWKAWYAGWNQFFADKLTTSAKLANVFYLDALEAEIEQKRRELDGWIEQYKSQVTPSGEPVPPPVGPAPGKAEPPAPPKEPAPWWMPQIPWYAWVAGAGVAGGLGYLWWRAVHTEGQRMRETMLSLYGGNGPRVG